MKQRYSLKYSKCRFSIHNFWIRTWANSGTWESPVPLTMEEIFKSSAYIRRPHSSFHRYHHFIHRKYPEIMVLELACNTPHVETKTFDLKPIRSNNFILLSEIVQFKNILLHILRLQRYIGLFGHVTDQSTKYSFLETLYISLSWIHSRHSDLAIVLTMKQINATVMCISRNAGRR